MKKLIIKINKIVVTIKKIWYTYCRIENSLYGGKL